MIVQGLPHACGGVSVRECKRAKGLLSSPRMWGCFSVYHSPSSRHGVFPTHVGVFLSCTHPSARMRCLPHACGGVSLALLRAVPCRMSSPRMWGCFQGITAHPSGLSVFPTHVGVFPPLLPDTAPRWRLPHACGGVSKTAYAEKTFQQSSPRMWGCFLSSILNHTLFPVFPTHVGVFLNRRHRDLVRASLPHSCGGVSKKRVSPSWCAPSSPRMWGCFLHLKLRTHLRGVFPTHVGVFPSPGNRSRRLRGLPHACGGVSTPSYSRT